MLTTGKTFRKILGLFIVSLPLIVMLVFMGLNIGFIDVIKILAIFIFTFSCVFIGIYLLVD